MARDRGAAGERGKNRSVPAGQQGADRRLGDIGDPGHRERTEAGDAKQARARHGARTDVAKVDAGASTRGEI